MVSAGAFASPWVVQQFSNESHFVLGTVLFTGGLLVSLPVNYLAVKLALKPLRRLSLAMEEVQLGNLDAETDIGGSADHQIALLSDSYKTMLGWIREDRHYAGGPEALPIRRRRVRGHSSTYVAGRGEDTGGTPDTRVNQLESTGTYQV